LIKQKPDDNDCLACVAAMLCDTTPEHFKYFCKRRHLDRFDDASLLKFIARYHWMPGIYFQSYSNSLSFDIKGIVCYLGVVSDDPVVRNANSEHAVLWDGQKILDPNPRIYSRPLNKYKITSIIPLCKFISKRKVRRNK
jgi:hypothetical protein